MLQYIRESILRNLEVFKHEYVKTTLNVICPRKRQVFANQMNYAEFL